MRELHEIWKGEDGQWKVQAPLGRFSFKKKGLALEYVLDIEKLFRSGDLDKREFERKLADTQGRRKSYNREIQKQIEFVTFLKSKGMYNEFESSNTMVKMQEVWEACNE